MKWSPHAKELEDRKTRTRIPRATSFVGGEMSVVVARAHRGHHQVKWGVCMGCVCIKERSGET